MGWSTGYSKILKQKEEAEVIVNFINSLQLKIGMKVLADNQVCTIKQIWVSNLSDYSNLNKDYIGIELEEHEDIEYKIEDIIISNSIEVLYGTNKN